MKKPTWHLLLVAASTAALLSGCASSKNQTETAPAPDVAVAGSGKSTVSVDGKSVSGTADDLDEYAPVAVADPLEPLNRATFWLNHGLYSYIFRPISTAYEFIFPKVVRTGLDNVVDNVRYPIRVVNHSLQGQFDRAGQETGKFLVNSTAGVGGLWKPSQKIPALADVPSADTGQTFTKWGIGPGFYFVIPLIGPSTARDTVGLAGDYVLNPITWLTYWLGGADWIIAIPAANTVRAMPEQLDRYDAATGDSLDRYLAARSSYIQYREKSAER